MMPQITALKTKPITEPSSTCAQCSYFRDFNDKRGQGWCGAFDLSAKRHHQKTSDCFKTIATLEAEAKPAFVLWVRLYSQEIEDDGYGYPVPVEKKLVEVVVTKPTRALVEAALAHRNNLHGYQIVDFWQPQIGYEI